MSTTVLAKPKLVSHRVSRVVERNGLLAILSLAHSRCSDLCARFSLTQQLAKCSYQCRAARRRGTRAVPRHSRSRVRFIGGLGHGDRRGGGNVL